jgi:hypothetical protein
MTFKYVINCILRFVLNFYDIYGRVDFDWKTCDLIKGF